VNRLKSVLRLAFAFALVWGGVGVADAQNASPVLGQQSILLDNLIPLGLSPDGNLLAAANHIELCTYQVPSMAQQVCADLEPLEAGLRVGDVSWSPDSTRLVLTEDSFRILRDGDLWVVDALTGELTNLTDDGFNDNLSIGDPGKMAGTTFYFDVAPAWSPDSEFITFSRTTFANGERAGNDIVTIPSAGGEPEVLLNVSPEEIGVAFFPMRWSPDGSALYYVLTPVQRSDPSTGIYRFDAATGTSEQLLGFSPDFGAPAITEISPAGDKILVFYPTAAVTLGAFDPIFWLFDLETLELEPLNPPGEAEDEPGFVAAAAFSPDGESLLIGTRRTTPNFQLWEVAIESGDATQLVESLSAVVSVEPTIGPSWTASGRIFVASDIHSGTLLEVPPRESPIVAEGPEPSASPPAVASEEFEAGDRAIVASNGVPLHAAPTGLSPAVGLLDAGVLLTVLGPAEEAEGVFWLPVQEMETRTIGFVRVELVIKG
jgi:dipeptidyl aminopeptidase/acylaminoacyl peptidase